MHKLKFNKDEGSVFYKELTAALEDPATYQSGGSAMAINRNLSAVSHDLARLTAEWESVTAAVSAALTSETVET